MHRILITVLTPVPGRPGLCAWCAPFLDDSGLTGRATVEAGRGLPEDAEATWRRLVAWAERLADMHLGRLRFRFLDPATPLGLWLALRHLVRRFPAFIFPDGPAAAGWDLEGVEARIAELAGRPA